jgi:hypothetical protein
MTLTKRLWIGIAILIILTPLGLILPDYFKAGEAWGEHKISNLWNAPLPDYSFKGWEDKAMPYQCFAYVIAAVVGIAVISGIMFLLGKILAGNNE